MRVDLRGGDVVIHTFDLLHSVNVTRGVRWSLIIWVEDELTCPGAQRRWYEPAALAGDAVAQFHLADLLQGEADEATSQGEQERLLQAARSWFTKSAGQGLPMSKGSLAFMLIWNVLLTDESLRRAWLLGGAGGPADVMVARSLMHDAALSGSAQWQYNFGVLLEQAPAKDEDALTWFRRAAQQGHAKAAVALAEGLLQKVQSSTAGAAPVAAETTACAQEALRWLEKSAEGNSVDARRILARLFQRGFPGIPMDAAAAERWHRRAQGLSSASRSGGG